MTAQVLDSDVRDFSVPEFRKPVSLGTPEILRARNAREFRLIDADAAVPVASREFSRAERLLIRFPAYAPSDAAPSLSAKLLNRSGQTMRELSVALASTPAGANEIDSAARRPRQRRVFDRADGEEPRRRSHRSHQLQSDVSSDVRFQSFRLQIVD